MPKPDPAVVYLTQEELDRLTSLYRSGHLVDAEQDALRFFLFMTFTAMHISDARALQIENIYKGEIHYRRMKTKTLVRIPLCGPTIKLLEHYQGTRTKGNLFVGLMSDQSFNRLIKRVAGRAGINKPISAKAARHTFATLYLRKNPADLATLSKLLGHASVNTTMVYAHIMKEGREAGMSVFDGML